MALERNTYVVGGLLVAGAIIAAGTVWLVVSSRPAAIPDEVAVSAAPQNVQAPESSDEKAPDVVPEIAAATPIAPSFDLVRVEADGSAIIAGQAAPGAAIEVQIDGQTLATAKADSSGKFVTFADLQPSNAPRGLSLSATVEGASVSSTQTVIVAPFAAPVPEVASADIQVETPPEPPAETAVTPVETPAQPVAEGVADASPGPTILLADEDRVTVLQSADVGDAPKNVSIDAITYDTSGAVFLSGRGTADGSVRIYVDNTEVTTTAIENDGQWRTDLPDVDKGVYTLRVDQISPEGQVVSRTETPFQREDATQIAAANPLATPEKPVEIKVLTVQPGNTLWAIANQKWGDGMLYVRVFEANKDRIRDPDLIYPGQVFDIPD